jgi:hypothetical protein
MAAVLLAACGGQTPAYVDLQDSIQTTLTNKDHRPVRSVACRPRVNNVSYNDGIVDLSCFVHFTDGTSYRTSATIEARSYQVAGYDFTWYDPSPRDITRAPLPPPSTALSPTSARSLFYGRNLRPIVRALARRFRSSQLILRLAIYPGELEAVVGASGRAQRVTVTYAATLTVGPSGSFSGERSGIDISQLNPAVPEELALLVAARGHIPMSRLDRFVLTFLPHRLAGWDIYTTDGERRFRANLQGDTLKKL